MNDQISFLPMLDGLEHETWLMRGIEAATNENDVYVYDTFTFFEGKLTKTYIEIKIAPVGGSVLFEFSYSTGNYGCGHPLSKPCHECNRNNSARFLADAIYDVFRHSVVTYDRNLHTDKERNELVKLCRKACDRIAKEVA